ncbi:ethanolamine ammonia-lyase subunit EutC [Methylovirgula sp. 4M-Z18]|uniref:ethanolamine ammonia-lyase subunit EutC n=2 Tax=Methylovirgula sp. 4M-Z18 TaxID=2293567 RepID=UPI000E2ECF15|nr:ethanolamine ammonia-lyase subunit EutC [Methylovirgula sp. 4M-Z18]RFB78723.1 ethanolamine ammonia-lyase subunit EutC [Methylovirgula sp. 4M-Z18]
MTKPDITASASVAKPAGERHLDLKAMTDARVALGRFGSGLPTQAQLAFLLDHAKAREAVWSAIDPNGIESKIRALGLDVVEVESLASERSVYVRRPDLGRRLADPSRQMLAALREARGTCEVVIIVADGLSSSAVEINAVPLVAALSARLAERGLTLAPIVVARQARVALGDPVGEGLGAKVSIILIGERPGLSAADSLGGYVTYGPQTGTPDSRRNCISNIREGGMPIAVAADAIAALVTDMLRTGISGVGLKDAKASLPN